jgi:PAS domain S-box-containing protein
MYSSVETPGKSIRTGLGYLVAIGAVLLALGVRLALEPILGRYSPYLPFTLAVMVAARVGGRLPGIAATTLSAVSAAFFFLEPSYSFRIADAAAVWGLALFVVIGCLISVLVGHLRESLLTTARAEERLREQLQLVNLSHDAIITMDAERRITGWNKGAEELYGWTQGEALGQVTHALLRTTHQISTAAIDAILLESGRWDGELTHSTREGRWIQVESRQVVHKSRQAVSIQEINRDITEQNEAQEELREAHAQITTILESISDGFNAFDRQWRYTYVNAAGARLVGKPPEELLGKNFWEVWPHAADSPVGAAYRRAAAENICLQIEAFYPEPLNRWHEVRCYPSPEGLTVFFTDTTERRHAEERLRQKQKLESIGLLAGGVAHDFNNLLTVIMGSAAEALHECSACEHSKTILQASERAAYLTKQLLAYAGKGYMAPKPIDLSELVSNTTTLLQASLPKRARLEFDLAKDLPCVEADPGQMEQIAMNLVINAGEAIPPKTDGLIRISTSSCQVTPEAAHKHSAVFDAVPGPFVCLEVRDSGCGMDERTLARIFDPFFTTKFLGRGLGLAAVHGIARQNGGFIEVRSVPGEGATFRVFLPASQKRPAPRLKPAPQREGTPQSTTVLIVEDEEMVLNLASMTLRRYGYSVLQARNGKEALHVLATTSPQPSIVLLDLGMPVMGGDELLPVLNANYPGLKAVITSGYTEEEARRRLSPHALNGSFLQKPYTGMALTEKIGQALETH